MIEFKGNGVFVNQQCGIYAVVNPDGEVYVGASRDIPERIRGYKKAKDATGNLKTSIFRHGRNNHKFYLLFALNSNDTDAKFIEKEKEFIKALKENGYKLMNLNAGGAGQSSVGRNKMKESQKLNCQLGIDSLSRWHNARKG